MQIINLLLINYYLYILFYYLINQCPLQKPTAAIYYTRMNGELKLKDVTWEKIRSKVMHLKTAYIRAVNWRNQTGQGVMEESGTDAVKGKLPFISKYKITKTN
jgi:hypothetical protein